MPADAGRRVLAENVRKPPGNFRSVLATAGNIQSLLQLWARTQMFRRAIDQCLIVPPEAGVKGDICIK